MKKRIAREPRPNDRRPTVESLEDGYRLMALDVEREAEAHGWVEGTLLGVDEEPGPERP